LVIKNGCGRKHILTTNDAYNVKLGYLQEFKLLDLAGFNLNHLCRDSERKVLSASSIP